jgi:hypothetical protein
MNKYSILEQAAISDIIFNYPAELYEIQSLINSLGFELTLEDVENEYNNRQ